MPLVLAKSKGALNKQSCIGLQPKYARHILQRIIFDTVYPPDKGCASCKTLLEVSRPGFTFKAMPLQHTCPEDGTHCDVCGCWFRIEYDGNIKQYAKRKPSEFAIPVFGNAADGAIWAGDVFGAASLTSFWHHEVEYRWSFRAANPVSPDYSAIKEWLSYCSDHHDGCKAAPLPGINLIDVDSRSLVAFPQESFHDYIALSYVWGKVSQKSMRIGPLSDVLPATIEDAIDVVRYLGMQFLWVDSIMHRSSK